MYEHIVNMTAPATPDRLSNIVTALQDPDRFPHPVTEFKTIETHISIVLLTGEYAYKFKKPVDFGFVDFTSLKKRRYFCKEELRLNRRLAPDIYLGVVTVGGDDAHPRFDSEPTIEYCVKMRQFPQAAELETALTENKVDATAFQRLAQHVARFHDQAAIAGANSEFGSFTQVQEQCEHNFQTLRDGLPDLNVAADLRILQEWTENQLNHYRRFIEQRRQHNHVRECHGDMHVTNMIWLDDEIRIFDCIEFNPQLRWIDVMNEIAFLLMDLDARDRSAYGRVFINSYLETSGDYGGLQLLSLFKVYRSLVRAKIAWLRAGQSEVDKAAYDRIRDHLALARSYIDLSGSPALIITHGLSGSGKTTITADLIAHSDAVRVRSDVERKRLQGIAAHESSHSGLGEAIYSAAHTEQTYQHLADCARSIIASGRSAIVDATFLQREQRRQFQDLAHELGVPFRILDCQAPAAVLRERIIARSRQGDDASEADLRVLERQLSAAENLTGQEKTFAVLLDTEDLPAGPEIVRRLGLSVYANSTD